MAIVQDISAGIVPDNVKNFISGKIGLGDNYCVVRTSDNECVALISSLSGACKKYTFTRNYDSRNFYWYLTSVSNDSEDIVISSPLYSYANYNDYGIRLSSTLSSDMGNFGVSFILIVLVFGILFGRKWSIQT